MFHGNYNDAANGRIFNGTAFHSYVSVDAQQDLAGQLQKLNFDGKAIVVNGIPMDEQRKKQQKNDNQGKNENKKIESEGASLSYLKMEMQKAKESKANRREKVDIKRPIHKSNLKALEERRRRMANAAEKKLGTRGSP